MNAINILLIFFLFLDYVDYVYFECQQTDQKYRENDKAY